VRAVAIAPTLGAIPMINDDDPVLISMKEVRKLIPLSRAEIDRRVKAGRFPPKVRLGQARVAFDKRKIVKLVNDLIRESDERIEEPDDDGS